MPFQPLLPNTVERHANFIAVQRVLTLPFSLTITVDALHDESAPFWRELKHSLFGKAATTGTAGTAGTAGITDIDRVFVFVFFIRRVFGYDYWRGTQDEEFGVSLQVGVAAGISS